MPDGLGREVPIAIRAERCSRSLRFVPYVVILARRHVPGTLSACTGCDYRFEQQPLVTPLRAAESSSGRGIA